MGYSKLCYRICKICPAGYPWTYLLKHILENPASCTLLKKRGGVQVDYDNTSITQNTRAAYPVEHIANANIPCVGPHPKNIILLCCDAFGVLPPVARLSRAQTMYHFVSGYTAKVAGTEMGKTPSAYCRKASAMACTAECKFAAGFYFC